MLETMVVVLSFLVLVVCVTAFFYDMRKTKKDEEHILKILKNLENFEEKKEEK